MDTRVDELMKHNYISGYTPILYKDIENINNIVVLKLNKCKNIDIYLFVPTDKDRYYVSFEFYINNSKYNLVHKYNKLLSKDDLNIFLLNIRNYLISEDKKILSNPTSYIIINKQRDKMNHMYEYINPIYIEPDIITFIRAKL